MVVVCRTIAIVFLVASWVQASPQQAPSAAPAAPAASDSGPEQPLPFSHKRHAGMLGLPCQTCHTPSPSGEAFRVPQGLACMQCHQAIAVDKPAIQKLADYAKAKTAIPWVRVYELPSFITFSHKTHLDHGATCQECHGDVSSRERLFKETDLSMKWCVDCHAVRKAVTDCNACHTLVQ
jgi:hypothetical protein